MALGVDPSRVETHGRTVLRGPRRRWSAGLTVMACVVALLLVPAATAEAYNERPVTQASPDVNALAITSRPGWPQLTDSVNAGGPMNKFIEGYEGVSGWIRYSSPTLGNLDSDPELEIAAGSLDGKVYVWNPDGSRLPGWPKRTDSPDSPLQGINGYVSIVDLDADGTNEVVTASNNGWVFAWSRDGTIRPGWPQFTGYNADFPANCGIKVCTGAYAAPVVVDLDGDGYMEVIAGGFSHKIFIWNYLGQVRPGWPIDIWDGIAASVAVGEIDGDGALDIVVGSDVEQNCADCKPFGVLTKGGIYSAWRQNGTLIAGWPVAVDAFAWSSPAIGDLDANGTNEVVAGSGYFPEGPASRGRAVTAWNRNGSIKWRVGTNGNVLSSPLLADINADGQLETIVGDTAGYLYVISSAGALMWASNGVIAVTKPNGHGSINGSPSVGDLTGDGVPEIAVTDGNWWTVVYSNNGTILWGESTLFSASIAPAIGDIDRDGDNELVIASAKQNGYAGNLGTLAGQGEVRVYNTSGIGPSRTMPTTRVTGGFPAPGPQYITYLTRTRTRARVSPSRARFTDTVILDGFNFNGSTAVIINGVSWPVISRTSTRLIVSSTNKTFARSGTIVLTQTEGNRTKRYRL